MLITIENMVNEDQLEVSLHGEVYVKGSEDHEDKMIAWDSLTKEERGHLCKVSEEFTKLLEYYKQRLRRT